MSTSGRPKKMDDAAVLRAAMGVFWAKGFVNTSVEDLLAAADVRAGSLYAVFGSKKELFLRALGLYRDEVVAVRRDAIEAAPTTVAGIRAFFGILIDHAVEHGRSPLGCLAINSAVELSGDPEVAAMIRGGILDWEAYWLAQIKRGQRRSDLRLAVGLDAIKASRVLVGLTLGINVLSKVVPERKFLDDLVSGALVGFVDA